MVRVLGRLKKYFKKYKHEHVTHVSTYLFNFNNQKLDKKPAQNKATKNNL